MSTYLANIGLGEIIARSQGTTQTSTDIVGNIVGTAGQVAIEDAVRHQLTKQMTTRIMSKTATRYSISQINSIISNGFNYTLPEETIKIISELAKKVGSPDYVKTPTFQKKEIPVKQQTQSVITNDLSNKKNRKKNVEITDSDWNMIRTFKTTKFDTKEGVDLQIADIKTQLNKLSNKNYIEITGKITAIVEQIIENNNKDDFALVSLVIFEIASNNRFYSKIYADLYSDLFTKYEFMRGVFETSFTTFLELFLNVEYVNPEENYDKFCKVNKDNEKRKSLSEFFINLMINKIISEDKISNLLVNLLLQVSQYMIVPNKKNEVDELIENIALLYKKDLFDCNRKDEKSLINELTVTEFITKLAKSKAQKDTSLTSKSIFKCMDITGM